MIAKICPITQDGCWREACGWWSEANMGCAIPTIADVLFNISDAQDFESIAVTIVRNNYVGSEDTPSN